MPKATEMTSASGSIAQPMVQTQNRGGIRRHHCAAAVATIACERMVGILRSVVAADLQVRLPLEVVEADLQVRLPRTSAIVDRFALRPPGSTAWKNAGVGSTSGSRERRCSFRCATDSISEASAAFYFCRGSRRSQSGAPQTDRRVRVKRPAEEQLLRLFQPPWSIRARATT